jgi:hypothetical protein
LHGCETPGGFVGGPGGALLLGPQIPLRIKGLSGLSYTSIIVRVPLGGAPTGARRPREFVGGPGVAMLWGPPAALRTVANYGESACAFYSRLRPLENQG